MIDRRLDRAVHVALLVLTAATALMALTGVSWPIRPVVTLVTAALLPGAAVLTRMPPVDVPTWCALACAFSLAIEAAGALAMVWLRLWNPAGLSLVLGAASAAVIVLHLRRTWSAAGTGGTGGPGSPDSTAAAR